MSESIKHKCQRRLCHKWLCHRCGECCRRLIIEIIAADLRREPKLRPFARAMKPYKGRQIYSLPSPCPMLKKNLCSIYKTRPAVCREFTPGSEQCRMARRRSSYYRARLAKIEAKIGKEFLGRQRQIKRQSRRSAESIQKKMSGA